MANFATKLSLKPVEFKSCFFHKLAESQLKAGRCENYYQTLTNFDFISLKIHHPNFGVETLIRDYCLIDDPEILDSLEESETLNSQQVKTLRLIQRTLELSSHVLNQDPNQLLGQLWGRLQSFPQPEIRKILADSLQSQSDTPRFHPMTASLTPPGGTLLRTLIGHNDWVTGVAITPDGKKAVSASHDKTLKIWDLETGTQISTFIGESSISCCAVSPDGLTIVAGEQLGCVHFLRLEGG